jgi:hypothetical protein
MKIRCPCCGAENSLDSLIANEDARNALWALAKIGGGMTKGLVMYLGLFRPEKSVLSQARMAKLMSELLPDIHAQRIQRGGKVFDAPAAAWAWAFGECVSARDSGSLKTPLTGHGYLYEVLSHWRGQTSQFVDAAPAQTKPDSSMVAGLKALEQMK